MKYISIIIVISTISFLIAFFIQTNRFMHEQAIGNCIRAGQVETQNTQGQKVMIPEEYWYNDCLQKMGYTK